MCALCPKSSSIRINHFWIYCLWFAIQQMLWINLFYWVKKTFLLNKKFQGSVSIRCAFQIWQKNTILWFHHFHIIDVHFECVSECVCVETERYFESSQSFSGLFELLKSIWLCRLVCVFNPIQLNANLSNQMLHIQFGWLCVLKI